MAVSRQVDQHGRHEHSPRGPAAASACHALGRSVSCCHAGEHPVLGRAVPARPPEPVELRYLRETRNAVVFIAVLAGVICLASLIIGIVAAVQLSKVSSELGRSGGSSSSNCLSQGGSDPSC